MFSRIYGFLPVFYQQKEVHANRTHVKTAARVLKHKVALSVCVERATVERRVQVTQFARNSLVLLLVTYIFCLDLLCKTV